jgi:hypothetical protein
MRGPSGHMELNESYFPVVTLDLVDDHDPDVEWLLAQYDRILAAGRPYTMLGNALKVTRPMDANNRRRVSDWMRANTPRLKQTCVGSAMVFQSALVRGAMTALQWVAPMPMPVTYPASMEVAASWCLKQLETARVPMNSSVQGVVTFAGLMASKNAL